MRHRTPVIAVLLLLLCGCWFVPRAAAATTSKKKKASHTTARKKKHRRKPVSPQRLRRTHRAFVASSSLRPMALQLLQDRTPVAYAGVEAYARRHAAEDAGALANLVLGYAHWLDHDYAQMLPPLRKAQPRAAELGDYVAYFLAQAQLQTGDSAGAVTTLMDFAGKYPDSIWARAAAVTYATALVSQNHPQEALAALDRFREPARPEVELALARAYLQAQQQDKAVQLLRHIYYTMPTAGEADTAGSLLKGMAGATASVGFAEQKQRADLLARAGQWRDAVNEYRSILPAATGENVAATQIALANALRHTGQERDARKLLESIDSAAGVMNAERLYYLAELARSDDDVDRFQSVLAQLRQAGPDTRWLEDALLSGGNMFLLKKDYDHAIDFYREMVERFPQGRTAPYAHWKVAWLNLRQNRPDAALKGFEEQITNYSDSPQVAAALYWHARLSEEKGDFASAHEYYTAITERYRNYYYADLARERLNLLPPSARVKAARATENGFDDPVLSRIPPLDIKRRLRDDPAPADDLRVQKALLLGNGGLLDFAVRELQDAADGEDWAPGEMARIMRDCGRYDRAIEVLKHTAPYYFNVDLPVLPRSYWEVLFPKPYWSDLKRYSTANSLDPFLVASLIRQESEFNPNAVSRANAVGLMQLLPSVGKSLARAEKVRHYNQQMLFAPEVNLQLGTRYFKELVDQYNGHLEYALAAYNAGTDRVDAWLAEGGYRESAEFVESIPFTETREYVQAILRNRTVYQRLYSTP